MIDKLQNSIQTYKIAHIDKNGVDQVYIFSRDVFSTYYDTLNEENDRLIYSKPIESIDNTVLLDIFVNEDVERMNENIILHFINDNIYIDDTLETIKYKISKYFTSRISVEEQYLFYETKYTTTINKIFLDL